MLNPRLKRCLHILAGIACAAASLACAYTAWQGAETIKSFRADAEAKDVGVLKQQEEKDVTFRLTNATDAPVEIAHISTTCACTRAQAVAQTLRPGESTEVTARLSAGSHRGQIEALVFVFYRVGAAQDLERLTLTIRAMVDPHYAVTPKDVVFEHGGENGKDSSREASITIAPNNGPAVQVLKAYSTHPAIRIETINPDMATGSTTIRLVFDPTRRIAPSVKADIIVHTDSKMEPLHRVPVRVVSKISH